MEDLMVEVHCSNENRVVGHLILDEKDAQNGVTLSARVVWNSFRPITEEYRLPQRMANDGHLLCCPLCQNYLGIKGDNKAAKQEEGGELARKRDLARERILEQVKRDTGVDEHISSSGLPVDFVHISLGRTKFGAQR